MRRLLLNRWTLLVLLWAGLVFALHLGQIRHNRLPLDLKREFSAGSDPTPGAILATTIGRIMEHELRHGFGWRPNDFFLWGPWLWADNNANRQLGVLQAVRETLRVMKDHLTKVSSDEFDTNLVEADTLFRNDARRLWFPAAESRYRDAIERLEAYVTGLKPQLATSRPINQRNMELVRLFQTWGDLLGDAHGSLYRDRVQGRRPRPWETDDLFYHAQGYAHVMAHAMRALEREYARAVAEREVLPTLFAEVTRALVAAATLKPVVILDGGPASVLANHRRNLDAYISEARQKMYSIREELEK